MNGKERGFLLLASQLGDPDRRPLTTAQLRVLARRVRDAERSDPGSELDLSHLTAMGYGEPLAQRLLSLLSDDALLTHYLRRGQRNGCIRLSRISDDYPMTVHSRLGDDAPGCIWAKGDLSLLQQPAIALVGSREIDGDGLIFAREVGRQAAQQGFVLVSGNARGADKAAQQSCLQAGGQVICVVADELERHRPQQNMLYMSEDSYDLPFSSQRALSRNRVIHCMGLRTFVARASYQRGGTWDGTVKNLRHRWSPVYCFRDGSPATELLIQMGADGISIDDLRHISSLPIQFFGLFDQ